MRFPEALRFEWDEGNVGKVSERMHPAWAELAFRGNPNLAEDTLHSHHERRWFLVNHIEGRFVFLVFTKRGNKIRIVSARFMHKKEVRKYEESLKKER